MIIAGSKKNGKYYMYFQISQEPMCINLEPKMSKTEKNNIFRVKHIIESAPKIKK